MPAVKKLKPIDFITERNLVLNALAVYAIEVQSKTTSSELLALRSEFYQKFKVEYKNVIDNSVLLIMNKIKEQLIYSQKDFKKIIKIYDDYINTLEKAENQPVKLTYINKIRIRSVSYFRDVSKEDSYWVYKGFSYEVHGNYSEDEIRLLILEDFDKERRMFEKLRAKFDDTSSEDLNYERPRIPEKVRIEVWRRDGGKCARCGSREKLEYDHIVPISKGGSNTARNIELLCEKCNRSKSNNVV